MNTYEVRWNLHNYHANIDIIKQIQEDLKEYRLMDGIKAQVITNMPIVHSETSKTELIGIDRAEYITYLEDKLDSMKRIKMAIDLVYKYLKEPSRSIIEMRYFIMPCPEDVRQRKYNWVEISEEMHFSEDYCKKIDGRVILKIQNKIHKIVHI